MTNVADIAGRLTKAEQDFVLWMQASGERHIDCLSTPRLLLIRAGILSVTTRDCHLYASLTPLGLAVRAHIQGNSHD